MIQISEHVFCNEFIQECYMESHYLPNPYHDYPYLIIQDFLSQEESNLIVSELQNSSKADAAMIKSTLKNSIVTPSVNEEIRKTSIYKLSHNVEQLYKERFTQYQSKIEDYFSMPLTTATQIQALEYLTGDFYIKHADDSNEILDKEKNCVGFVCVAPQRKLTTVLFVSTHEERKDETAQTTFDGGELVFNYLFDKDQNQIHLKPKAGELIIFPSNPCFSHEVLPVKSGYRATLVQWHNTLS